jgi:hypothetical protein
MSDIGEATGVPEPALVESWLRTLIGFEDARVVDVVALTHKEPCRRVEGGAGLRSSDAAADPKTPRQRSTGVSAFLSAVPGHGEDYPVAAGRRSDYTIAGSATKRRAV